MFGRIFLVATLLAGCAEVGEANGTALVNQAHSLAAEWALVNSQAARGNVSTRYATMQRSALREQLGSVAGQFDDPGSAQAGEVRALLALPPDAPAAAIRAHGNRLEQIANSLEAA